MPPGQEYNIDDLLRKASRHIQHKENAAAFDDLLQALDRHEAGATVSFRQLSRTGILLLLILIANVILISNYRNNNSHTTQQPRAAQQTGYLESYNLNLYE